MGKLVSAVIGSIVVFNASANCRAPERREAVGVAERPNEFNEDRQVLRILRSMENVEFRKENGNDRHRGWGINDGDIVTHIHVVVNGKFNGFARAKMGRNSEGRQVSGVYDYDHQTGGYTTSFCIELNGGVLISRNGYEGVRRLGVKFSGSKHLYNYEIQRVAVFKKRKKRRDDRRPQYVERQGSQYCSSALKRTNDGWYFTQKECPLPETYVHGSIWPETQYGRNHCSKGKNYRVQNGCIFVWGGCSADFSYTYKEEIQYRNPSPRY